jgi:spermidine/putrescine transport system substrate-binding protein
MAHPKERPDLSRREFLRRAAATGIAVPSLAAILAACRDSSEPTPSGDATTSGAGPTTAGVLADFDNPMELPVHDDVQPIEDGLSPEAGPLRVYNWNLYIFPRVIKEFEAEYGVEIEYTQFNGMAEAMNKINNDTIQWDLFFPTIENVSKLATAKRIRPWNRTYMENTANIWPSLLDPWYDQGGRYTLPYLTWKTGIGYRRDFVDDDFSQYEHPFDVFWDTQYAGKVGVLDEYRETIGMALLRNGGTNFNSTDAAELATATDSLIELIDAVNVEIGPGDYQKLAEGTSHVRYSWSGNMNFARWYLADPEDEEQLATLGYYYPPEGGWEVANDTIVLNADAESPVLAHLFLNFLMDRDVALTNFGYEGFQPPLVDVTPEEYLEAGAIPPTLENTLIAEEDFAQGQPVAPLMPEADQLYQDEWARFKAGVG